MPRMKFRNRRGSVLIWLGMSIAALMMLTAVAVDFGIYYVANAELQTSADASALRGAMRLQTSLASSMGALETDVDTVAVNFAARNSAQGSPVAITNADVRLARWTPAANATDPAPEPSYDIEFGSFSKHPNAVVVTTRDQGHNFFGRIFGGPEPALRRSAVAWIGNLVGTKCLRPWGLPMSVPNRLLDGSVDNFTALSEPEVVQFAELTEAARTVVMMPEPQDWPNNYTPPEGYGGDQWTAVRYNPDETNTQNQGMDEFRRLSAGGCLEGEPFSVGDPVNANFPANTTDREVSDMVTDGKTNGQDDLPKTCHYNLGDATCFASETATVPGVKVRVAYITDVVTNGTDRSATAVMLGEVMLLCMYHGNQATGQSCQADKPGAVTGFTEGTMVFRLEPDFAIRLNPEDELHNDPSTSKRIILVR